MYNKPLLDEGYCDLKIINVEVRVISRAKGKMITLTETLIILHMTKTESNNCFIIDFKPKIINMARGGEVFANFVYFCTTRGKKSTFDWKVVEALARNTNIIIQNLQTSRD